MYLVKIYKGEQILDISHYHRFENVVAAISDKTIFREGHVPKKSCWK